MLENKAETILEFNISMFTKIKPTNRNLNNFEKNCSVTGKNF